MTQFSPTPVEPARAEACAGCARCAISEAEPCAAEVPYEIHITVEEAEIDGFRRCCADLGVKPILLALQLAAGGTARDVMTSSVHVGTDGSAIDEAERIARGLSREGFRVVRSKIETVPWHPQAPSRDNGLSAGPGRYFETHLAIACRDGDRDRILEVAGPLGLHLSRNVLKDRPGGGGTVMATARSYATNREDFRAEAERCKALIEEAGFPVEKLIVEFALYDSHDGHDSSWIGRPAGSVDQ